MIWICFGVAVVLAVVAAWVAPGVWVWWRRQLLFWLAFALLAGATWLTGGWHSYLGMLGLELVIMLFFVGFSVAMADTGYTPREGDRQSFQRWNRTRRRHGLRAANTRSKFY